MSTRRDEVNYATDPPQPPQPTYNNTRGGGGGGKFDGTIKAIGISVLTAGILALIAMVFAINETNAAQNGAIENLRLTDTFVREQIAEVKGRQDRIEGKVFRGTDGTLMGDFGADERQPR